MTANSNNPVHNNLLCFFIATHIPQVTQPNSNGLGNLGNLGSNKEMQA